MKSQSLVILGTSLLVACTGKTLDVGTAGADKDPEATSSAAPPNQAAAPISTTPLRTPEPCGDAPNDGPSRICISSDGLIPKYETLLIYTSKVENGVLFTAVHNIASESAHFDLTLSDVVGVTDGEQKLAAVPALDGVGQVSPGEARIYRYEDVYPTERTLTWNATSGTIRCEPVWFHTRIRCVFDHVEFSAESGERSTATGWLVADWPR